MDENEIIEEKDSSQEIQDFSTQTIEEIELKKARGYSQHFDADIHIFGERTTLTQIVVLLAYLRDMIQSKTPGDLKLSVGKHLDTDVFSFTVNGQEISHIKAARELEIN